MCFIIFVFFKDFVDKGICEKVFNTFYVINILVFLVVEVVVVISGV